MSLCVCIIEARQLHVCVFVCQSAHVTPAQPLLLARRSSKVALYLQGHNLLSSPHTETKLQCTPVVDTAWLGVLGCCVLVFCCV